RSVVAIEPDVRIRRAKVLPEGEDIDVDFAQIAHHGDDLLDSLTHAENHTGLGRNIGCDALGVAEDLHHSRVATSGPRFLVESRHRFGVVIVDLGSCLEHGADAVLVALKIWYENFDRTAGNFFMNLANGFGEYPGAEVGKVIAVDRCDHGVL